MFHKFVGVTTFFAAVSISMVAIFSCKSISPDPGSDSLGGQREILNVPGYVNKQIKFAKPWEIRTDHLETVVPDIFYADASQNDQIIPTKVDLGQNLTYEINHVIYPTIGNPNLYTRKMTETKVEDSFLAVLRLSSAEAEAFTDTYDYNPGSFNFISGKNTGSQMEIKFYLVPRANRNFAEDASVLGSQANGKVFEIIPSKIIRQNEQGLPTKLTKGKATYSFYFAHDAMKDIPAVDRTSNAQQYQGLYDLRVEFLSRPGTLGWREFHYNALRVFENSPGVGDYNILNITDTQISVSKTTDKFREISLEQVTTIINHLTDVYTNVDTSNIAQKVKNADFITFNGDLHNGGSPLTILPEAGINTYRNEASEIIKLLRELPIPIFLTVGNHDGYASVGHAPKFPGMEGELKKAIERASGKSGVGRWEGYIKGEVKDDDGREIFGGKHLNIFQGNYVRRFKSYVDPFHSQSNSDSDSGSPQETMIRTNWYEVPEEQRNVMLYDGFNQWRRTYGPTYSSWTHGKNHFININSFDLRQHRRTGWVMYTPNYGGGISGFQSGWIRDQIDIAEKDNRDTILIAHHDPRGGHNGHDYPYYFRQIDFYGMGKSAEAFIQDEIINPKLCAYISEDYKTDKFKLDCLHDGLQEWMRPDAEFDCTEGLLEDKSPDLFEWARKCNIGKIASEASKTPFYSGYDLIHKITTNKSIRTLLLGHTHYSSIEVYRDGAPLVPKKFPVGEVTAKRLAEAEMKGSNPVRVIAQKIYDGISGYSGGALNKLDRMGERFSREMEKLNIDLSKSGHSFNNKMKGHELAIIRLTSAANMSSQQYAGTDYYGYSVLAFKNSDNNTVKDVAQLSEIYLLRSYEGGKSYGLVGGLDDTERRNEGYINVPRGFDIRYRKFDDLVSEASEDADYLVGRFVSGDKTRKHTDLNEAEKKSVAHFFDIRNPFRRSKYALKTEGEVK